MEPAIQIDSLSVSYGQQKVLKNISIDLPQGGIVGLLGPNGAGKTTLIRTIVGRLKLTSGSVKIFGLPAGDKKLRSEIGYMTQAPSVYPDLTVRDNIRYFAVMANHSKSDSEDIIKELELGSSADKVVAHLSGGQRSRVSLAGALIGRPKLLVLDEPTVGLDPLLRSRLWQLFDRLADNNGTTILVSSHVMDEAVHCKNLLLLREGKILDYATPEELLRKTHTKSIEDSFIKLIGAKK